MNSTNTLHRSACWRLIAGAALAIAAAFAPGAASAQAPAPLLNEGFEAGFQNDAAGGGDCAQNTCQVPAGWGVWFTRRTDTDAPGVNLQPRYEQTRAAGRFKTGAAALRYYTSQATHTGGVYRIVTGVTVGAKIKLSAAGQVWSTNDESPISARPSRELRLKIGIDPLGGDNGKANPFSPQIVWSEEQSPADAFKDFAVEVEAKSSTVVVYLFSTMRDGVRHNDVFWDDVLLTTSAGASETGAATPATEATPAPTPTLAATEPPAATNDVTYTIVAGDSLIKIADENGITVAELERLNPGVNATTLQLGAVLIVKKGSAAPAAEFTPTPAGAPAITGTVSITGTPTVGTLCVQAYFDEDGNGRRAEQGEDLVPQILFEVTKDGNRVGGYTTDGVNDFCFENLQNGEYIATGTILQIYQPSSPPNDKVLVRGGRADFMIGIRRRSDEGRIVSATATPAAPITDLFSTSNLLSVLAVLGGLLMIIGLIGFLISAFLRRRRL